jgi:hypothetical protein
MNIKLCILVLLAGLSCGLLKADRLEYTVTTGIGAGQALYQFTLTNSGDTGGTLFDLFLSLPTPLGNINTATIGTPAGWGDPTGGLLFFGPDVSPSTSFIEWTADFSGVDDVAIGSSLSGFSFTAVQPIEGPINFALNDSTTFAAAVQGSGVPEPATFVMLLPVAAALGFSHRFRPVHAQSSRPRPATRLTSTPIGSCHRDRTSSAALGPRPPC